MFCAAGSVAKSGLKVAGTIPAASTKAATPAAPAKETLSGPEEVIELEVIAAEPSRPPSSEERATGVPLSAIAGAAASGSKMIRQAKNAPVTNKASTATAATTTKIRFLSTA